LPAETPDTQEKLIPATDSSRGTAVSGNAAEVQEHWVKLRDGNMRYLKTGSGPTLILVHGLMGYSFSWRFTMPALAPHATVFAIDNLGAGLSKAIEGMDCSARATAERVLEFADAVGIEDFDLLGTSHGGGVAIMVAALCRERLQKSGENRLRRLVLVAPVNPWSTHGKRLAPFLGGSVGTVIVRNTIERSRAFDSVWLRRLFGDVNKIPLDSLEGYRVPARQNHGVRHGVNIVRNWTKDLADIEAALPTIRDYPTLLIWGTKDLAVSVRSAKPLAENFRDARLAVLEGVGHLPYEEAPEDFNRALIEFLT
jgi:pimeloyl-ACP methyl ester carboxylesterase